jgi:hypothetical protein
MLKSIAVEKAVLCCSYQTVNEIIEKCTLKQPEPHQTTTPPFKSTSSISFYIMWIYSIFQEVIDVDSPPITAAIDRIICDSVIHHIDYGPTL